jgi:L-fuconolactonase
VRASRGTSYVAAGRSQLLEGIRRWTASPARVRRPGIGRVLALGISKKAPSILISRSPTASPLVRNVGDAAAVRREWRAEMTPVRACPNVVITLCGVGMLRLIGPWDGPRTSERQALCGAEMIRWCIDAFGVERCMFESN